MDQMEEDTSENYYCVVDQFSFHPHSAVYLNNNLFSSISVVGLSSDLINQPKYIFKYLYTEYCHFL